MHPGNPPVRFPHPALPELATGPTTHPVGRRRAVHRQGRPRAGPFCAPTSSQISKVKCDRENTKSQGPTPDLGRPDALSSSEPPCGRAPTGVLKSGRAGSRCGWNFTLTHRQTDKDHHRCRFVCRPPPEAGREGQTQPGAPNEVERRYTTFPDPFPESIAGRERCPTLRRKSDAGT